MRGPLPPLVMEFPLILCWLCRDLYPPGCTPTGHRLAVPCPRALGSALPIPGPGLSRCSTNASRISLNCPCSLGSGIFTCQVHTVRSVKALPPPGHLGSEACGEGGMCHSGPWTPSQPVPLIPRLTQSIHSPRAPEPMHQARGELASLFVPPFDPFLPLILVEHLVGQPVF